MSDTHVLVDEQGVAVMSGSFEEMARLEREMLDLGHERIAVRTINESWHWEQLDWGD